MPQDGIIGKMTVLFDSFRFGEVVIGGKSYGDLLVVGEKIEERDDLRLERELGTDHLIGDWEVTRLLSGHPEIVLIGTGTVGVLKVEEGVREKIKNAGAKLVVLPTPLAIREYNTLVGQGKRVNALIHSTC